MMVDVKIHFNFSFANDGKGEIQLNFLFNSQDYNEKFIEEINKHKLKMEDELKRIGYSDIYVSLFSISSDREEPKALF